MKVAVLGANWSPCAEPMDQMVVPATGLPSPSVQVKAVPPHSCTSIPRCRLYQACNAGASLALKKMPPMPVTRFMEPPRWGAGKMKYVLCGLTINFRPRVSQQIYSRLWCSEGFVNKTDDDSDDRPLDEVSRSLHQGQFQPDVQVHVVV